MLSLCPLLSRHVFRALVAPILGGLCSLVAPILVAVFLLGVLPLPVQAETAASARMAILPLNTEDKAILVDVAMSGKEEVYGSFILDTGATYTSITREMARKMGLDAKRGATISITTANGKIEVPKVIIPKVSVNGLEARNVEAVVVDLNTGSQFSGMLGLSFIRHFQVTIDHAAGRLIFRRPPNASAVF